MSILNLMLGFDVETIASVCTILGFILSLVQIIAQPLMRNRTIILHHFQKAAKSVLAFFRNIVHTFVCVIREIVFVLFMLIAIMLLSLLHLLEQVLLRLS